MALPLDTGDSALYQQQAIAANTATRECVQMGESELDAAVLLPLASPWSAVAPGDPPAPADGDSDGPFAL